MYELHGIPTIGLPGTIDNDLNGTDQTIGCSTAINTALESIDKIRDTAQSMERIFVVEVMGNKSGYIAMEVALAAGAEDVIIPERPFDYEAMHDEARKGNAKGKVSWIIIVAEGAAKAQAVAENITKVRWFGNPLCGFRPCAARRNTQRAGQDPGHPFGRGRGRSFAQRHIRESSRCFAG